jgi:indolepyruvate ferredoxin oxidoreductase
VPTLSATERLDTVLSFSSDRALLTGTQTLIRLLIEQKAADAGAGSRTAGFISGYRGSPLGGLDLQILRRRDALQAANIRFEPGINEELAATAVSGAQLADQLPGARYQGVFCLWYGKGPGVDRAGDAIRHGNRLGTAKHGGVLLAFGDDHAAKSSTTAHQSEQALSAHGVPVLYPATVQEYLEYGLYGYALSRYSGLWVGLKCVNETAEASQTVDIATARKTFLIPEGGEFPLAGIHARVAFDPVADEIRLMRYKLPLAQLFARTNGLDRVTHASFRRSLGIVAAGKSWLDTSQALRILKLTHERCAALGVRVYKPGMIWPLEPVAFRDFARGHEEILFVEEKAAFLEVQGAHALYSLSERERPQLAGKSDATGATLLPSDVQIDPLELAAILGSRLEQLGLTDAGLSERLIEVHKELKQVRERSAGFTKRIPYFCSGCPHNISTKVPEKSIALAGIGCHGMAMGMNRNTLPPTQMGGEGSAWIGVSSFTDTPHAFQNLGDGTYFHSGSLAIRAAVAANVNLTFKILYNDAVAMTGGQQVEGHLSVAEISHQLAAERVRRIAVVTDDVGKYAAGAPLAVGATLHSRESLDAVQLELRALSGVSAIIYDQTCAAELRRRRKRGILPEPPSRAFINERVCEGCGDCSSESNCLAVEPVETELGRKRKIDQSSCNKDLSCIRGFCPSFATVERGTLKRVSPQAITACAFERELPPVTPAALGEGASILVAGIGGSGIVTVGAILAMAAHREGLSAGTFDMTGLAQKGGAVLSHIRIGPADMSPMAARIGWAEADVVLGCDLFVAASAEVLRALKPNAKVIVNRHLVPTASFQSLPDMEFHVNDHIQLLKTNTEPKAFVEFDATQPARSLLGEAIGANMIVLGYAFQLGWLPLQEKSIEDAIKLNGAAVSTNLRAFKLGRLAAIDRASIESAHTQQGALSQSSLNNHSGIERKINRYAELLREYQNEGYARRYRALIDRVAGIKGLPARDREELLAVVAPNYFKLLAYKDEYEVARLYTNSEYRRSLEETFEKGYRLRVWLAPPFLSRHDPGTGAPKKISFGPWIFPLLRVLAKCKPVRGSWYDPFAWSHDRRLERALIVEYERLLERIALEWTPARHDLAVKLADGPSGICGFGHIKERAVREARRQEQELLAQWDSALQCVENR